MSFELNMVNKESSAGDLPYLFCYYTPSSNFHVVLLILPLPELNGYQAWKMTWLKNSESRKNFDFRCHKDYLQE